MPSFRKAYVEVIARFKTDGGIVPLSIVWEDGRIYEIDQVCDIRQRVALKVGGIGLRFTCRINGREVYLFLEESRWFVEAKVMEY